MRLDSKMLKLKHEAPCREGVKGVWAGKSYEDVAEFFGKGHRGGACF